MRELAIGDIHGCARAFQGLLEIIQPQSGDTIVLLGDYVDRGPDTCQVIDMILELNRQCTVIPLTGNHEVMMQRARTEPDMFTEWLRHGGNAVFDSYERRGYTRELEAIPAPHWKFLSEQTLDYWETDERIYVHANLDPTLEMDEQPEYLLFWQRFTGPIAHKSGKTVICGHTSQKSGLPVVFEKSACIDTWVYGDGWLTCFDPEQQIFTQCRENGEHRTFDLQKLTEHADEL